MNCVSELGIVDLDMHNLSLHVISAAVYDNTVRLQMYIIHSFIHHVDGSKTAQTAIQSIKLCINLSFYIAVISCFLSFFPFSLVLILCIAVCTVLLPSTW